MAHTTGKRCTFRRLVVGRLCTRHAAEGAVIPDGWAGELPVFHLVGQPEPAASLAKATAGSVKEGR